MSGKTPLLLVPGVLCDASLWAHQTRHLADVAEMTNVETTQDADIAAMVDRALETAPPRFALAGLSMGGYVALEFWRRVPERITKLALLDTSARPDSETAKARRLELIDQAEQGRFKGVTPRLMPTFVHPDRAEEPGLVETITSMAEAIGREAFIRQQHAVMARVDSRPDLATIDVATLVICGREDAATPLSLSEEIASGISGARLCVIEECGHMTAMERPHAVTALMRDWLLRD